MKLIKDLFPFRLSENIVKDVQCVSHIYSGRECCHGNILFAVDVVIIVLHINGIIIN